MNQLLDMKTQIIKWESTDKDSFTFHSQVIRINSGPRYYVTNTVIFLHKGKYVFVFVFFVIPIINTPWVPFHHIDQ